MSSCRKIYSQFFVVAFGILDSPMPSLTVDYLDIAFVLKDDMWERIVRVMLCKSLHDPVCKWNTEEELYLKMTDKYSITCFFLVYIFFYFSLKHQILGLLCLLRVTVYSSLAANGQPCLM